MLRKRLPFLVGLYLRSDRLPAAAAAAESALADVPLPQLPPAVFVRIAAFPAEVEVDAEMVDEWAVPREKAEEPAPVPRPVEPPLAEDALEQLLVMLAGVGGLMSQLLRKFSSMSGSSLLPLWLLPAPGSNFTRTLEPRLPEAKEAAAAAAVRVPCALAVPAEATATELLGEPLEELGDRELAGELELVEGDPKLEVQPSAADDEFGSSGGGLRYLSSERSSPLAPNCHASENIVAATRPLVTWLCSREVRNLFSLDYVMLLSFIKLLPSGNRVRFQLKYHTEENCKSDLDPLRLVFTWKLREAQPYKHGTTLVPLQVNAVEQ
ncbi:hypothetical protein TYRP_001622 [Tyrophagus putrescentiae]|nr:hypothetical protein TYRP_001622 [Tyrophagus putrescentiae]